jgi:hypothetical protein
MPAGRMPDRGVDRPPTADEVQLAKQYARRMHQAREVGLKRIDKRTPGGRFNARAHMRGHAQRTIGAPVTALIPGIRTGGGTAFGGDTICLCAEHLEFANPSRPRFQYVVSDGGWYATQAGVEKIHELRELGVPVVHISIGLEPLSVEADKVVTITDPATAMDIVAADTVAALHARRGPR